MLWVPCGFKAWLCPCFHVPLSRSHLPSCFHPEPTLFAPVMISCFLLSSVIPVCPVCSLSPPLPRSLSLSFFLSSLYSGRFHVAQIHQNGAWLRFKIQVNQKKKGEQALSAKTHLPDTHVENDLISYTLSISLSHTHTHTHTLSHAHTHAHTHTHTHTYTHTHTHTHTHFLSLTHTHHTPL